MPVCFKRITVVPNNLNISREALRTVQVALVNIWQQHISEWHSAEEVATVVAPPTAQSPQPSETPVEKRGHVLKPTPNGGIFCCKCGHQTQYVKHVRLKITKSPCPNASLPPAQWLSTPCRMAAVSRLDDLFRHAQSTLNRDIHSLVWNRKSGKQPTDLANFGLLYCRACGRTWPWMRRHTVCKRTTCQPPDHLPPPPPWVPGFLARLPRTTSSLPKAPLYLRIMLRPSQGPSHRLGGGFVLDVSPLLPRTVHRMSMLMVTMNDSSSTSSQESCHQVRETCHVWESARFPLQGVMQLRATLLRQAPPTSGILQGVLAVIDVANCSKREPVRAARVA